MKWTIYVWKNKVSVEHLYEHDILINKEMLWKKDCKIWKINFQWLEPVLTNFTKIPFDVCKHKISTKFTEISKLRNKKNYKKKYPFINKYNKIILITIMLEK